MSAGLTAIVSALADAAEREALREGETWKQLPHRRRDYALVTDYPTHVDEERVIPPVDGLYHRHPEPALCAAGWRFVAVPRFVARKGRRQARPALDWVVRDWLAVPPEGLDVAARHFDKKRFALEWAASLTHPEGGDSTDG